MNSNVEYFIRPKNLETFSTFSRCPLEHNFHTHPMLQLESLKNLAHYLYPKQQCRFVKGEIQLDSAFDHEGQLDSDQSLDQVFEHINRPRSWIALYNVESHPEYAALLNAMIDHLQPYIEPQQTGISHVGGFIFISSPPSVTPFHIDRENNFWLQISGEKDLTVFDHQDRTLVSLESVERFIAYGDLSKVRLKDEHRDRGQTFKTTPGDGVYFPSTSPHMTQTHVNPSKELADVSISLGLVFYTDQTRQQARAMQCHQLMRKLGLNPKHEKPTLLKSQLGKIYTQTRQLMTDYQAPKGSF